VLDSLQAFFTADASLWSLLAGSFIAATVLPFSSEAMLFAVLKLHPELFWPAVGVATLGNTAGGMVTYAMGRFIPHKREHKVEPWVKKHGEPLMLLAWAPVIGDGLCLAAGWLRLAWWHCLIWMAIGKGARYLLIAALS
jgi:membrane protein YqaA with SNARE-associated domain